LREHQLVAGEVREERRGRGERDRQGDERDARVRAPAEDVPEDERDRDHEEREDRDEQDRAPAVLRLGLVHRDARDEGRVALLGHAAS